MIERIGNINAAQSITRGACRMLVALGYNVLREFKLTSGRRVDIAGLNKTGKFIIVEVKSSKVDFQSDDKWQTYLNFCDQYYFAVDSKFPKFHLPTEHGLIIADAYNAIIDQSSMDLTMNGQRRRAQTLRFARTAASRLQEFVDSRPLSPGRSR